MQKRPGEVRGNPGTEEQGAKKLAMAISRRDHRPEQHDFSGMPANGQWLCPTKFRAVTIS